MAEAEALATALSDAPTRHDVLSDAFDKVEDVQPQTTPKPDRTRDEAGKFATPDKAAPAKVGQEAAPGITASPVDPLVQPEPVWKKPPNSWKKDYHEAWAKADPRLQEYAFQREEQMKAGVEPLKTKAEFADSINQVLEPFQNTIRGLGLQAPQVIKGLLEADNILRTAPSEQKLAYLVQIAQNYGVNLQALTGAAQRAPAIDPNYHSLANQLNLVRGEITSWKQQQEAVTNQELRATIEDFASASGHEHFETVKPTMAALLQSGQAKNLDEAYKKAVRLDDELYEADLAARQANASKAKDDAAKSARAAAVSVRGSTPGSHTATKATTRREMLVEQFGGIDSRV